MEKKYKITMYILLFIFIILIILSFVKYYKTGDGIKTPNNEETQKNITTTQQSKSKKTYSNIIYQNLNFNIDGKITTLRDYSIENSINYKNYAFVNLDNDNDEELIIKINDNEPKVYMFKIIDNNIYCYIEKIVDVYKNGTYLKIIEKGKYGFFNISLFNQEKYADKKLSYYDNGNYFINDIESTKDEFDNFINNLGDKVDWETYPYTYK